MMYYEFVLDLINKNSLQVVEENQVSSSTLVIKINRGPIRQTSGVPLNNHELNDKWLFYNLCKKIEVSTPRTSICEMTSDLFSKRPIVLKKRRSSQGKDVDLIFEDKQILEDPRYILQEPILNSLGTDYRVLLIDKKVVGVIKRENSLSFKANIAQGGVASAVALPESILIEAEVLASSMNSMGIIGLDLIMDGDSHCWIEVNTSPAVKTFFKIYPNSKELMEEKLMEVFLRYDNIFLY